MAAPLTSMFRQLQYHSQRVLLLCALCFFSFLHICNLCTAWQPGTNANPTHEQQNKKNTPTQANRPSTSFASGSLVYRPKAKHHTFTLGVPRCILPTLAIVRNMLTLLARRQNTHATRHANDLWSIFFNFLMYYRCIFINQPLKFIASALPPFYIKSGVWFCVYHFICVWHTQTHTQLFFWQGRKQCKL